MFNDTFLVIKPREKSGRRGLSVLTACWTTSLVIAGYAGASTEMCFAALSQYGKCRLWLEDHVLSCAGTKFGVTGWCLLLLLVLQAGQPLFVGRSTVAIDVLSTSRCECSMQTGTSIDCHRIHSFTPTSNQQTRRKKKEKTPSLVTFQQGLNFKLPGHRIPYHHHTMYPSNSTNLTQITLPCPASALYNKPRP